MRCTFGHGRNSVKSASSGEPGIPRDYMGRWFQFGESGQAFSKIVLIKLYYSAYVATMTQGGDKADNAIISYKLQRSTLYTIHEIKCRLKAPAHKCELYSIFGLI